MTVVDLSPGMLELDRRVASERGLEIELVQRSMEDLSCFSESSFDAVFQPVSTCYVPDIEPVFSEIARVLKCGGLYLSQHKQPGSLQSGTDWNEPSQSYLVARPCISGSLVPDPGSQAGHRETGTVEFLHRLQDIFGGICRAGFSIEDVVEPRREKLSAPPGTFEHRSAFLPPFIAIKARRTAVASSQAVRSTLWTPG